MLLRAARPTASIACIIKRLSIFPAYRLRQTFSSSDSTISPTGLPAENAVWLTLMRGSTRCFEMISAEFLYPIKQVSQVHLNPSQSISKEKSWCPQHETSLRREGNSTNRRTRLYNFERSIIHTTRSMDFREVFDYNQSPFFFRFFFFSCICHEWFYLVTCSPSTSNLTVGNNYMYFHWINVSLIWCMESLPSVQTDFVSVIISKHDWSIFEEWNFWKIRLWEGGMITKEATNKEIRCRFLAVNFHQPLLWRQ